MMVNIWIALSTAAIQEFLAKEADPAGYDGPMDDFTFKVLSKMADRRVVQGMFKPVDALGKTYRLFSINVEGSIKAKEAIDDLTAKWPEHIIVVGAWWFDGRQVGTSYDEEGNLTGTPLYPIHPQAWRFMPDTYTYDQDGNVTGTVSATSNADLRDVNLLVGQKPRNFD